MNADRERVMAASRLTAARALIAGELLDLHRAPLHLGEITLHPHQRRAVVRVARLLARYGGALLADPTGLGKTYVALGAARDVERILIICPAAMRESWRHALARVGRNAPVVSLEQLSRGLSESGSGCDLVIVDESHHLRNVATRRYAAVASLCDRRRVLLLSATPVQNRRDDLVAQLALFLGDAAYAMSDLELARVMVRRDSDTLSMRLPAVVGPHWIALRVEDDVLEEIAALPPSVPLVDEGQADALLRYTLLRQWSSSRAALLAGLRGRLARGIALVAALESGRHPTRQELAAWSRTDDSMQLALPELLVSSDNGAANTRNLLDCVEAHVAAVRALIDKLRHMPDPDPDRTEVLRKLKRQHGDRRIIAFSQYAETVRAIARLLMTREGGVAELTSRGGRVAGGRLPRDEVLAQFAPGRRSPRPAERIDLLVTTDVVSEGLDLQRASVIVHLDLPWNPARLEQRVGRVRRLGGAQEQVFVYALAPPAPAERVLDVEARLRSKLRIAGRFVGIGTAILPGFEMERGDAAPSSMSELLTLLERWRSGAGVVEARGETMPVCAAARASMAGYLALLADGDDRLLVASTDGCVTLDPRSVRLAVALAEGSALLPEGGALSTAVASIAAWWAGRISREEIRVLGPEGRRTRARIGARIDSLLTAAPRHARAKLAPMASAARHTLRVPLGIGAERQLALLDASAANDECWLRELAEIGRGRMPPGSRREPAILALIVLVPEGV